MWLSAPDDRAYVGSAPRGMTSGWGRGARSARAKRNWNLFLSEKVVRSDVLRSPQENKARMFAIPARGKCLAKDADYFVILLMAVKVNHLVDAGVRNFLSGVEFVAHLCHAPIFYLGWVFVQEKCVNRELQFPE